MTDQVTELKSERTWLSSVKARICSADRAAEGASGTSPVYTLMPHKIRVLQVAGDHAPILRPWVNVQALLPILAIRAFAFRALPHIHLGAGVGTAPGSAGQVSLDLGLEVAKWMRKCVAHLLHFDDKCLSGIFSGCLYLAQLGYSEFRLMTQVHIV
jgi:hypothetical protein